MNNHLKKLVRFVYNDKDECYHFIDEYIINPSKENMKTIKDSFIRMNKSFNNDFAYSILNVTDKPCQEIYTGMRICDRAKRKQYNLNPSLLC